MPWGLIKTTRPLEVRLPAITEASEPLTTLTANDEAEG